MKTEDIKRMALAYQAVAEKKMDPVGQADADIDNDDDVDKSDKYLHNRRKAIKKAMSNEAVSKDSNSPQAQAAKRRADLMKMRGRGPGFDEAADLDADNAEKAIKHDCATHVTSEKFGHGTCISGMHTIEEQADGTGIVTHYDVLFEHGIEEMVPVSELTVTKSESHGHARKKKMSESSVDSYGATKDAEAHAQKDGANYKDVSVQHKYDAYHMKKRGYTHFEPGSYGTRRYTKGPTAHPSSTKIGPDHHSGVSESVEEAADRAAHYKGATPPEPMTKPEARSEKKMKDGHPVDSEGKFANYDELGHDDASKAGRVTKKSPMRKGDNAASDKMQAPVDTTKKGGFSEMVHSIASAYRSMYKKDDE